MTITLWAIEGLEILDEDVPQPFVHAIEAARSVKERMAEAPELADHGEIGRGRNRGDNVTSTERGNTADYLAARIKRDRPDIAEAVERGEFKSIRQAALAAGIVKDPTAA